MGLFSKATNKLLDASIFFSFDKSGFDRHRQDFRPQDLDVDLSNKVCLITGANSGLGYETAKGLAKLGANVHLLCRNLKKGLDARDRIKNETKNPNVHTHQLDVSCPQSIDYFARAFDVAKIDVLVHNAGLLPHERQLTREGFELTVATHVIGPFILTERLRAKLFQARVIFVSSGGMYTKRLNLKTMLQTDGRYDGVSAYAMTKRAQVVLAELMAPTFVSSETVVHSMHPGWAATPGVADSLPGFSRFMRNRLRTPQEGADTIIWLSAAAHIARSTGQFWFDRMAVTPYLLPATEEDAETRAQLYELCTAQLSQTL